MELTISILAFIVSFATFLFSVLVTYRGEQREKNKQLIYTTNAIEGFNRQLRKVTKSRTVEYYGAVTPQIRQAGNRLSGLPKTNYYASLLA